MPEAETPEPVAETVEPEAPVVEDAPEPPKKSKPRRRAPRKIEQIHEMAAQTVTYCDNHPGLPAVLVTDRGGRTNKQAFCVKCAAKLPANYADAR